MTTKRLKRALAWVVISPAIVLGIAGLGCVCLLVILPAEIASYAMDGESAGIWREFKQEFLGTESGKNNGD